jgi:hypothetical protein
MCERKMFKCKMSESRASLLNFVDIVERHSH